MDIGVLIIKVVMVVILGFLLYRDARGRDFSWSFWTFIPIVIFLSPSLLLSFSMMILIGAFYFILRPKGFMLNCPRCGKKIHEILTVCPFCQKDAKQECLQCHEPVPWEADRCPYCKSRALTGGG